VTARTGRALRLSYLVASLGGVGFFAMSIALLGVWPKRVIDAQAQAMAPEHALPMTASEIRGRGVYGREGCAYCHSQQVRYLKADMARFGAPTLAWETRLDYPQMWGTRRIGPDLSRESGARPQDWQFTHLFAPRSVVSQSIMPSYTWLFDSAADRPTQDARDLVAYLDSLGHARELAGTEGEAHAREACNCPDDEMRQMAFEGPLDAHPARTRRAHDAPADLLGQVRQSVERGSAAGGDAGAVATRPDGALLYATHCASCHGVTGLGDGPGGAALRPRPPKLAAHDYTAERLADALWNGVFGTAMPAWRDRPPGELAALASAVTALAPKGPETPLPGALDDLGARVYTANCVQCHGERGEGNGPAVPQLAMDPTNFTRERPTLDQALSALRDGIEGTPMAPWTSRLSDGEILAAARYVRGFYAGAGR